MTKTELINDIARRTGLPKKDVAEVLDASVEIVSETLASGGQMSFAGFGKFHVAERSARPGVNPRTGEPIQIAAAKVPRFTPGSALKRVVNS
jgi:nucleoid DNA-binding protein